MRALSAMLALGLCSGCGQTIYVILDGGVGSEDAQTLNPDAHPTREDASGGIDVEPRDAGARDAVGPVDLGVCAVPCFLGVQRTSARIDVREVFTTSLIPGSAQATELDLSVESVSLRRRPGLPAATRSDIQDRVALDADGQLEVEVTQVPAWFSETTYVVVLLARNAGDGPRRVTVEVTVRGNVIHSRDRTLSAIDSGGRAVGWLVDRDSGLLRDAQHLLVGRGGELFVLDTGGTGPQRIVAVGLDGPNRVLRTFDTADQQGQALLRPDQFPQSLEQLRDGRIAVGEWSFGDPEPARILFWTEDGRYEGKLLPQGRRLLGAFTPLPDGNLLVFDRDARELVRIDPSDGRELQTYDVGRNWLRALITTPRGDLLAGGEGKLWLLNLSGGRQTLAGLPDDGTGRWDHLDLVGEEGAVAGGGARGRSAVLRLSYTRVEGTLLTEGAGPTFAVDGLAYLD